MRISIFGMGYVGCVCAGCLTDLGHEIVAVESNPIKLAMITEGKSPVIETGVDRLISNAVQARRLRATADFVDAIHSTDLTMVCVGTPNRSNGSIDLSAVLRVCEQIGQALSSKQDYYTVVVRSTVVPGTVEERLLPMLQKTSGKKAGRDFGLCMNPEFLREGTSIADFYHPSRTVIGEFDRRSGDALSKVYEPLSAPMIRTKLRVAEMTKYADNTFHALKISFANEIGNICKALEIDSHEVMSIFCADKKLNLSASYLKPGFAFGGSCLPKDLRSICYQANEHDIEVPLLNSILNSNRCQIQKVITKLLSYKGRSLGFLGLSFKEGTDDLRESPTVEVIETMIGKGFNVRVHDHNVSMARLIGANKEYIDREIPHIAQLFCSSADELIRQSDVIVVTARDAEYARGLRALREDQVLLDLVRLFDPEDHPKAEYYGICW
ncbi:MAG: nucleotide sugar dehydrogenase [Nitrospirae bacterium]|nr:MAG: nucleotide sugar dehydrogenase [Nitrospirota bacterium]